MRRLAALLVVLSLAAGGRQLGAQAGATTVVRVLARDSTRRTVAGAEITVVRGLNDVVARATTDGNGRATLSVAPAADDLQLVARRIGYDRVDRFIHVGTDSVTFDLLLTASMRTLDAVTTTAERNLKRESYHIDADDIANSNRLLIDATDILGKLRPDMICGRECNPMGGLMDKALPAIMRCPVLVMDPVPTTCPVDDSPPSLATNVWVNGVRIRTIPPDPMAVARQAGLLSGLSPGTMTVLSQIKPEHIEEMNYLDSTDTTVVKAGAQGAIFIVLKPGVVYQPGEQSYVAAVAHPATAQDVADTRPPAPLPLFRYRLLGVYDEVTGDPIADADVLDVETGDHTRTAASGIISLVFLPEGGSPLRITKPGYEDLTLAVQISPETMRPLTLTMVRKSERSR
jgi:hypothetical protein